MKFPLLKLVFAVPLLLFFSPSGLFTLSGQAFAEDFRQNLSTSTPKPTTTSFLNYLPDAQQFPQKVRAVFDPLRQGISAMQDHKPEEAALAFDNALEIIQALFSKLPRGYHDELYHLQGYIYERLGKLKKAREAYDASLQLRAANPVVIFREAYLLRSSDRCEEAIPKLREVLWRTKENTHEVLYLTADCLLAVGKRDEAMALATDAYQKHPAFLPVLRQLVQVRQAAMATEAEPAKRPQLEGQIATDLAAIVKQDPTDRASALTLSRYYLKQADPLIHPDRLASAEELVRKFALQSNFKDDESVRVLFDALLKRGKIAEAEETLKKGLEAKPTSATLKEAAQQLELVKGLQG